MPKTTTCVVLGLVLGRFGLHAQEPPDTVRSILVLHQIIQRQGPDIGPNIWPGFRPDTIPALYVIPQRAKLFVGWRDVLPPGFRPVPGEPYAAWTDTQSVSLPSGRFIAFNNLHSSMTPAGVIGLAIHEAFHSYERSVRREGRRFGGWENAMLVSTYPVFNVENEAAFALEGRVLRQAIAAPADGDARRLAREFLALRSRRQARLDSDLVEFERMSEMNEGLAQYALLRGLLEIGRREGMPWRAAATAEAEREASLLDSLLTLGQQSVRRRFYATGSAMGLLLDRIDSTWKSRLVSDNQTMQEALAIATGFHGAEGLRAEWADRVRGEMTAVREEAERAVAALRARREAQADSILAPATMVVVLDPSQLPDGRFQWCGFDPQNTLQVGDGRMLHMSFLRACAGSAVTAQFDQPVVEEQGTGVLRAALDDQSRLVMTSAGQRVVMADGEERGLVDLRIDFANVTIEAKRVTVRRVGREMRIIPR